MVRLCDAILILQRAIVGGCVVLGAFLHQHLRTQHSLSICLMSLSPPEHYLDYQDLPNLPLKITAPPIFEGLKLSHADRHHVCLVATNAKSIPQRREANIVAESTKNADNMAI